MGVVISGSQCRVCGRTCPEFPPEPANCGRHKPKPKKPAKTELLEVHPEVGYRVNAATWTEPKQSGVIGRLWAYLALVIMSLDY